MEGHLLGEEVGLKLQAGSEDLEAPFLSCFRKSVDFQQEDF